MTYTIFMLPIRMEQNALDTAVRKFASTVAAYNATQVEYDKNVKARVKGVLKTVLNKSDAELDEETYQSVLNIQRSMVHLKQMFMDLAYLVNEQGESIDRIEMNVVEHEACER